MPIEAEFHVTLLLLEKTKKKKKKKNSPGHVTKMATMFIYGKHPLKTYFSETSRPMTFNTKSILLPNAFI